MTSDAIFKELICGHLEYALDSLRHCYCAIIILACTSKRHDGYIHFQIVVVTSVWELGHGITVRPGIGASAYCGSFRMAQSQPDLL